MWHLRAGVSGAVACWHHACIVDDIALALCVSVAAWHHRVASLIRTLDARRGSAAEERSKLPFASRWQHLAAYRKRHVIALVAAYRRQSAREQTRRLAKTRDSTCCEGSAGTRAGSAAGMKRQSCAARSAPMTFANQEGIAAASRQRIIFAYRIKHRYQQYIGDCTVQRQQQRRHVLQAGAAA